MRLRDQVREFMRAAGQPVRAEPGIPSTEEIKLRLSLISEEFLELLEAVYPGFRKSMLGNDISEWLQAVVDGCDPDPDLASVADALADLDYVVEGTRLTFGIYGPAVADEVHKANMRKFGPGSYKREDGKHMKPPDWVPPDIERVLQHKEWKDGDVVPNVDIFGHVCPRAIFLKYPNGDGWACGCGRKPDE